MLILLVDDDIPYAEMSAATLRQDGHRVVLAASVDAACTVLAAGTAECVIVDVMEDGSGLAFARASRERDANLPIVFVSRTPSEHVLVDAYEAGADDFVAKPFNPVELLLRVRAVMRRSAVGAVP